MILSALEITAIRRSAMQGHRLGPWTGAKRKFGSGAMKAICMACGKQALLSHNGYARAKNKSVQHVPGIRGEDVFGPSRPPHNRPLDGGIDQGRPLRYGTLG